MVTLLESGLFGHFNSVFIFLFVVVVVYAVLISTEILGKNNLFNITIAVILGIFFASSSYASRMFAYATPWFVLLFLVVFFLQFMTKFMGAEKVFSLKENTAIVIIILVLIVIIFIMSAGQASKEEKEGVDKKGELEEGENPALAFPQKVGQTLRHPAILGLMLVMLIAVFAILLFAKLPPLVPPT